MKVKCAITVELDTGNFELKVENITKPGEPIDYTKLKEVMKRVFERWDEAPKD